MSGTELMLRDVRLSYPHLFSPDEYGKYSASLLVDETHPDFAKINQAIEQVVREKWGEKSQTLLTALKSNAKLCLRQGEDGWFVSASNQIRPRVIDRNKTELTPDSGKVYGGCYVNALISLWPQDNSYGKRINAELRGVQFVRDGEAFGGGKRASVDDFPDMPPEEDSDALLADLM